MNKPKGWDLILPQAEFAYNNFINRTTGKSPFQIVYGSSPQDVSDLKKLERGDRNSAEAEDFAKHMKSLHDEVRKHIDKNEFSIYLKLI